MPAVTSAWSRIWQPLRQAWPDECYPGGKTLLRVEPRSDGVAAIFADGSQADADLIVAADGLHSTVRAQLLPSLAPAYAGYVAWRGVVEEHEVPAAVAELVFQRMVFGFPDGELVLSLPMPGPQRERMPASGAAISSGFGRCLRQRWPISAPTRLAASTACPFRRR